MNPYTMVFGKEPYQLIARVNQTRKIVDSFMSENPPYQVYMITGVRGSGKTVLMTEIAKRFKTENEWIVVELNPDRDLLNGLVAALSSDNKLVEIFKASKINLSVLGFGIEVSGATPITDVEIAAREMLESLKRKGKKILITIDEVTNTQSIREFTSAFQIMVRQELPVFLLMTGLYENINALQDEKNLTFLYRAPKIEMKPLDIGMVADKYEDTFCISHEAAIKMARMTKGYPFAFQALGYLTWEQDGDFESIESEYRGHLAEYVYAKIWSELSTKDKQLAYAIAKSETGKVKDIRERTGMSTNEFNPYRNRLIKKGILDGSEYGMVKFTLPYFERYVLDNYYEE